MENKHSPDGASPPCYAGEAGDAYSGYLPREELIELLNALAEAERAGVKVTQAMRDEAPDLEIKELLDHVRRDEARFCGMVSRLVQQLGGTPSLKTGGFYEKALAIEGFEARLAFLNRGQGWVVRKLKEALPKLRDDALHAELKEMLETHEANIGACDRILGA